ADVDIRVDRLASVGVTRMVTYANGDRAQYLDHTFACTYLGGEPHPADGENTDVRWFPVDDLPELRPHMRARIEARLADAERTRPAAPDGASTATGIDVAVASAVFGVCAHGLAAGTGAALPSSEQLLMLLGASAGVGAVTAALARRRSPVLLSVGGLLAGQG